MAISRDTIAMTDVNALKLARITRRCQSGGAEARAREHDHHKAGYGII